MIKIIEDIIDIFKPVSETVSIHDGDAGSLFIKLKIEKEDALDILMELFKDYLPRGELILANISSGEFRDMRRKTIEIKGGYLIEYYDYNELSHIYLRIYSLTDSRVEWTSLYIDWSKKSAWWR